MDDCDDSPVGRAIAPAAVERTEFDVAETEIVGKDACVVLWTDNPLSIYATVDKTIIDGAVYYDRVNDELMQKENAKEKARIIEKMINAKKGGAKTQPVKASKPKLYHCDTVGE